MQNDLLQAARLVTVLVVTMADSADSKIRPAREIQPDRLPLGTVREDSSVEASVRVFFDTKSATGLAVDVIPPTFVLIRDIHVGKPEEGSSGGTVFCDVFLSIDTERAGDHSGHIQVQLGEQRGEVPISVTIVPGEPGLTKMLVVETPFQRYSTGDATIFSSLLDVIRSSQIDINYTKDLPEQLSELHVILLAEAGLMSVKDIAPLKEFVDGGRRLILAASYFFSGTVGKANTVLDGYGLCMEDTERLPPPRSADEPLSQRTLELDRKYVTEDRLTDGIEGLVFFRPSPIEVTDKSKGKILVQDPSCDGKGFVAVSRDRGEVVVLGQSLWWSWMGSGKDNARLLQNMISP